MGSVVIYLQIPVQIITLATILTFCDCIVAQDVAASESLIKLKSRNPQDIVLAQRK
jgi:hypothetical protein